ncbi:hypothetical protein MMC06_006219, partial [Schaereria dolodes]|nr:hypothetical protein [Schaereria dolodes]
MSGTRDYGKNKKNTATPKGLKRYYDKVLHPKLKQAPFDRIVLIDHSGGGGSVDGFRKAFWEILYTGSPDFANDVFQVPMVLINVIDETRKPDGSRPVVDPVTVPVLKKIWVKEKNLVNGMLGDEKVHPRLVPSYPASQWETAIKDSWTQGDKDSAKALRDQITSYMNKNGGLIKDNNPPKN